MLSQLKWSQNLKEWSGIFLILAIFFIPFQIKTLIFESPAWGNGFFNPYGAIFLYLFEVFILFSAFSFLCFQRKNNLKMKVGNLNHYLLILICYLLVLLSLFKTDFSMQYLFALSLQGSFFLIFYYLIVNKVISAQSAVLTFVFSMSFQSLIALIQFFSQSSIGLGFLGELKIDKNIAHLAKINLQKDWIRAYGTLPHPNILGGFLSLSIISLILTETKRKNLKYVLISFQFLALILTFSRSALMALTGGLIIISSFRNKNISPKAKKIITASFIFLIFTWIIMFYLRFNEIELSFKSRISGIENAIKSLSLYPFGTGLKSFTLFLDTYVGRALMPWEYQPVHNIYLLMLSELGVLSVILILYSSVLFIYETYKKNTKAFMASTLFIIAFIGFFDHYWLSLNQGFAVFTLFFSLSSLLLREGR